MMIRRWATLLAFALMFVATGPLPARAQPAPAATQKADQTLTASDGRSIPVFVWPAADPLAVVVFSHGLGGAPVAYDELLTRWSAAGFTVVAPVHVDSRRHADGGEVSGARAFMTRIADLAATRAMVKAAYPGQPLIVAGHSFGSLLSLMQAGAVTAAGPMGDPEVRAVVALSSAGDIEGLVTPETYAGLAAPLLMVTGDADTVPGYAPDWRAHRSPFDRSPAGNRMLVIFEGGGHNLVAEGSEEDRALLAAVSLDFMRAHGLGDAGAAARLEALQPPADVFIERR